MIQNSICNFLVLSLEDQNLSNIKNFDPKIHLSKWLRIISPFNFSKDLVQNLNWEEATKLIDNFVIQYGVKETLNLDYVALKMGEEDALYSAAIQILIVHSAFNDIHFDSIVQKMEQQKKECLLTHLQQFTDEFKEQIQYYFQQEKQTLKSRNEILKILVETEKKLAEQEEKNKLLKASLEDRQKIKSQYQRQLNTQRNSILELQDIKNFNQEQIEQQTATITKQEIEIQQLQKQIDKLKRENNNIHDNQSKIYNDMSDMKDKIDIYESQIKENRKKIIENNDLHFQLRQNEQKMINYKDLQQISHDQKYQIQVLESKNQGYLQEINTLKEILQKKEKTIEFFKELQKEFEQKSSVSLSKIIALEKDNKRFQAFNKSLMQKVYLEDKKQFNINDYDQKIFRKSWIQDDRVQGALVENYRNELMNRDKQIEELKEKIKQLQQ